MWILCTPKMVTLLQYELRNVMNLVVEEFIRPSEWNPKLVWTEMHAANRYVNAWKIRMLYETGNVKIIPLQAGDSPSLTPGAPVSELFKFAQHSQKT